jgi:xylulokinase
VFGIPHPVAVAATNQQLKHLPVLHAAGEVVGQVHGAAAQATGLPQGLEVMCGLGDAAATTLGAGMTHASQSYAYLGTSGWVATLAQDFHRGDMPLFLLPYPEPGWHIRIGPISNAGSVHRWALQFTLKETEAQAYAELESLVTSTATDPDVVFLPYLSPERLPVMTDKPQGSFVGLSLQTTRADMLRAVLEGVASIQKVLLFTAPYASLSLKIHFEPWQQAGKVLSAAEWILVLLSSSRRFIANRTIGQQLCRRVFGLWN